MGAVLPAAVSITDDKENPLRLSEMSDFAEPDEVQAVAPVSRTSVTAKMVIPVIR